MPEGDNASDAQKAQLVADGLVLHDGESWRLSQAGHSQLRLLRQIEGG